MLEEIERNEFDHNLSLNISQKLVRLFKKRRTTRTYSGEKIPEEIIDNAIQVAASAPSGANKQPWLFCKVSDPILKNYIRVLSEEVELDFYKNKPNQKWLKDLSHLHTNEDKSFINDASHLIIIFYKNIDKSNGEVSKNYYAKESTGIATGMLLSSLHLSGINSLTYTPKNMHYLNDALEIDKEYRAMMIVVAGIAPKQYQVPLIDKKGFDEVCKSFS